MTMLKALKKCVGDAIWRADRQLSNILPAQDEQTRMRDSREVWSGSEDSDSMRDLSHWRGQGRWDDAAWRAIGEQNWQMFEDLRRYAPTDWAPRVMMEWGSGGGGNAVRFLQEFETCYGVDISQPNLDECAKQMEQEGLREFVPLLVPVDHPEAAAKMVEQPLDFFLSTAVYQHFPGQAYAERVNRVVCEMLRPGGLALIQIRYDDGRRRFRRKVRDYRKHFVTFTSFYVDEFWLKLEEAGLEPLQVRLRPRAPNYAYYFARMAME